MRTKILSNNMPDRPLTPPDEPEKTNNVRRVWIAANDERDNYLNEIAEIEDFDAFFEELKDLINHYKTRS